MTQKDDCERNGEEGLFFEQIESSPVKAEYPPTLLVHGKASLHGPTVMLYLYLRMVTTTSLQCGLRVKENR